MRRALLLAWMLLGCAGRPAQDAPRGLVYVVPFGDVGPDEADRAAWAAGLLTGRPTRVLAARPLPAGDPCPAGALLDALLLDAPANAFRIVGVTDRPLTAPEYRTVIGYARLGERALVYSTAELPPDADEGRRRARVRRLLAHELGHTFGASHCDDDRCVMQSATEVVDLDHLPDAYCPRHRAQVERALRGGPGDADWRGAVALERMRLGRWGEALGHLQRALEAQPDDARLLTTLGTALMARGELAAADAALRAATRSAPDLAQPLYVRAVLAAAGPTPQQAVALLEAAVTRDPDPLRAHRAAGIAYQDLLGDRARAAQHFEAHLRAGGRDPEVVARLVQLRAPSILTFTTPEVVVARPTR